MYSELVNLSQMAFNFNQRYEHRDILSRYLFKHINCSNGFLALSCRPRVLILVNSRNNRS